MRKSLRGLALILAFFASYVSARAASPVAVTGNIQNILGVPITTNSFVRFRLRNFSGYVPHVLGTANLAQITFDVKPSAAGLISTTLWGNNDIQPGPNITYYTLEFWYNGREITAEDYLINSGMGTFNFNTMAPLVIPPSVPQIAGVLILPTGTQNIIQPSGSFLEINGQVVTTISGSVTVGHCVVWISPYQIGDAGGCSGSSSGPTGAVQFSGGGGTFSSDASFSFNAISLNLTSRGVNKVLYVDPANLISWGVSDLGAAVNAAYAALPASGGRIHIVPAASCVAYSTPILLNVNGKIPYLEGDASSSCIQFTGTAGAAITIDIGAAHLPGGMFGIHLKGSGGTAVGLQLGIASGLGSELFQVELNKIENFKTLVSIPTSNSFKMAFIHNTMGPCANYPSDTTSIGLSEPATINLESINFVGNLWFQCGSAWNLAGQGEFNVFSDNFDDNLVTAINASGPGVTISLMGPHFENVGGGTSQYITSTNIANVLIYGGDMDDDRTTGTQTQFITFGGSLSTLTMEGVAVGSQGSVISQVATLSGSVNASFRLINVSTPSNVLADYNTAYSNGRISDCPVRSVTQWSVCSQVNYELKSLFLGATEGLSATAEIRPNSGFTTSNVTGTLFGFGPQGAGWVGQVDTSGNMGIAGSMNASGFQLHDPTGGVLAEWTFGLDGSNGLKFLNSSNTLEAVLSQAGNLQLNGLVGSGARCLHADAAGNIGAAVADCGTGSGSTNITVNGGSTLPSPVNLQNGGAVTGLSINVSNPSLGNVQWAISGTLTDAGLTSAYSGVVACSAHNWTSTLTRNAAPTCTQPTLADIAAGTAPSGSFNFSGATLTLSVSASTATTANGQIMYQTGTPNWHIWDSGADKFLGIWAGTPVSGNCVDVSISAGTILLGDAGAPCGTGSGAVTSVSGDGVLITNVTTTGAVTLTLGTAGAHKVWMNNTGSTATPGYQSIGVADLPGSGATTVNGQSCALNSTCTIPFDVNGSSLTSQVGVSFRTSTTNSVGLTATPVNGSTNQVKFEITGTSFTGNSATATALFSAPSLCSGQAATGIAASGNAAGCFDTLTSATDCASAASPAVCGSSRAGSVVVAASATTVVVNTTKVSANSEIILTFDSSLSSKLSVTCNTNFNAPYVSARSVGTSFTITSSAPTTNPACIDYEIVN